MIVAVLSDLTDMETNKKLAEVRRDFAWTSEYKEAQLRKLKQKYFGAVASEHIVVRAFHSDKVVRTFSLRYLPPAVQASIERVHTFINKEQQQLREKLEVVSFIDCIILSML